MPKQRAGGLCALPEINQHHRLNPHNYLPLLTMSFYTIDNGRTRQFTAPLNYITIDLKTEAHRLAEVSLNGLRQLQTDAVVLKNFLSKPQVHTLLQNLLAIPQNRAALTQSKTYPFSFALLNRSSPDFANELKAYYRQAKQFKDSFARNFGIDMEQKFTQILSALNQNQAAKILDTAEDGSYIPFTFRMIVPEKNHINLHADNMFPQFAPEFYEALQQVAEVKNQLSFFTVLQKPESGGQLSIYNVAWDVAKEFNIEEQSIILENGKHLHTHRTNELFRHQLDLEEGDLVIFPGGQLYHRIEEVYGSKMRITLGGFIGYSKTNEDVYYWS